MKWCVWWSTGGRCSNKTKTKYVQTETPKSNFAIKWSVILLGQRGAPAHRLERAVIDHSDFIYS